jgi:predicted DNA-binding transcriptional regulator AlpA
MASRNPALEAFDKSPGIVTSTPIAPFIKAQPAARLLGLSVKTLLRYARQGIVPAHPLAGQTRKQWRFLESELYAWAQQRINLVTSDPRLNSRRK